jgi:hypothetical protein
VCVCVCVCACVFSMTLKGTAAIPCADVINDVRKSKRHLATEIILESVRSTHSNRRWPWPLAVEPNRLEQARCRVDKQREFLEVELLFCLECASAKCVDTAVCALARRTHSR